MKHSISYRRLLRGIGLGCVAASSMAFAQGPFGAAPGSAGPFGEPRPVVSRPAPIPKPVESTLAVAPETIAPGESASLSIHGVPSSTTCHSSDARIARVDGNHRITGLASGLAVVNCGSAAAVVRVARGKAPMDFALAVAQSPARSERNGILLAFTPRPGHAGRYADLFLMMKTADGNRSSFHTVDGDKWLAGIHMKPVERRMLKETESGIAVPEPLWNDAADADSAVSIYIGYRLTGHLDYETASPFEHLHLGETRVQRPVR